MSAPACGAGFTPIAQACDYDHRLTLMEVALVNLLNQARSLGGSLDGDRPALVSDVAWLAWRRRFSALCDRGICTLVDLDVEAQFDSEA